MAAGFLLPAFRQSGGGVGRGTDRHPQSPENCDKDILAGLVRPSVATLKRGLYAVRLG
jgi:hypothetical protein